MEQQEISRLVEAQRAWFRTGATLDLGRREQALDALRRAIRNREAEINRALEQDLGKCAFESYFSETGMVLSELSYQRKHLRRFAKPRTVPTPLAQFAAKSYRLPSPYGVCLIMSPWNYPLLLTLDPLIDAIAAGNTAILKPSAYAPHTAEVLKSLIADTFDPEYVTVVTGGREENKSLLSERFDYIFFTGSQTVGREVMAKAAANLTPVTLELGGKSPCIVDKTANLPLAARRIVFGKFLNCGQTCVAPDYVLCDEAVKDALVAELKKEILRQYGSRPLKDPTYGRIINEKHFNRLLGLLDPEKTVHGGETDRESCRITPTVLTGVDWSHPSMGQEIFGPILPVLTYRDLEEAVSQIHARPHPLALYYFTEDAAQAREVMARCGFGGGCINDVVIHLATTQMPFGGFGESGMGCYHGKAGFEAFTHFKSIVDKKTWLDLPMRYRPYKKFYGKLIRFFLR